VCGVCVLRRGLVRACACVGRYQREQMEGTALVYKIMQEKKLLKAFACLRDTNAYSEPAVRPLEQAPTHFPAIT
jgi:hypothetical protein